MTDIPTVMEGIRIPGAFQGRQVEDLPTGLRARVEAWTAANPAPEE